jgi:hypothetical protein
MYACHKASYHHNLGRSSILIHNLYLGNAAMLPLSHRNNFAMGPCVYKEGKGQRDTSNCMDEGMAWETSFGGHMFAHMNEALSQGYLVVPIPSHTSSCMQKVKALAANYSLDIAIVLAATAVDLGSEPEEPQILHFLTTF